MGTVIAEVFRYILAHPAVLAELAADVPALVDDVKKLMADVHPQPKA